VKQRRDRSAFRSPISGFRFQKSPSSFSTSYFRLSNLSVKTRCAFTLLELLVVIAIIIVVLAFTVPAVTGLSKSSNLNSAGRIVANLLTVARSEAINTRSLIRFEIATTWPSDPSNAYRKVVVVKHDATTGTDSPLTNWQTLPTGVVFQDPSALAGAQQQTPNLTVGSQSITTYYVEFQPTGALNIDPSKSPVTFRLVPGFIDGTNGPKATSANNWFDISVDSMVGRVAITRP
jgi:prepilin-type N-terminal cleavage/methylation domain-containing protein